MVNAATWRLSGAIGLGLLLFLLADPGGTEAGAQKAQSKTMSIPDVVAAVRPSVVTVLRSGLPSNPYQSPTPAGSGSGIVIDRQGHILTNNHLVQGAKSVLVGLATGRLTPGRVVARDFLLDLALVKITAKDLVPAKIGRSSNLQIGESVVAIGNPFALKGGATVTVGVVSALGRAILAPNGETLYDLIQTDAAINPGNSGGPLVDLSGRVVGINVAVAPSAQAISYAISFDAAYPNIQSMLVRGDVLRPDLGMIPVTVTPSIVASFRLDVERGVLAAQIDPSKQAALSGLKHGDVITAIDNRPIHNLGDFWHNLLRPDDQRPAQLTIYGEDGETVVSLPRAALSQASR
ncbi:MAG: trypsin-like peptidase domain-containing protein [Nitrospirales bacterium]